MKFDKLAEYLNSFDKSDPSYDLVCFIKEKIGRDSQDFKTINNGQEENLEDNDITMSTPEQQSSDNLEGNLMDGAFKELDALNQIEEEKREITIDNKQNPQNSSNKATSTSAAFGDNVLNRKEASFFSYLQKRLKK